MLMARLKIVIVIKKNTCLLLINVWAKIELIKTSWAWRNSSKFDEIFSFSIRTENWMEKEMVSRKKFRWGYKLNSLTWLSRTSAMR